MRAAPPLAILETLPPPRGVVAKERDGVSFPPIALCICVFVCVCVSVCVVFVCAFTPPETVAERDVDGGVASAALGSE